MTPLKNDVLEERLWSEKQQNFNEQKLYWIFQKKPIKVKVRKLSMYWKKFSGAYFLTLMEIELLEH